MKHILVKKQTTWEDVFSTWQSQEGADPVWQNFATKEKGWESWEAWREYQFGLYGDMETWNWELCSIDDPNMTIPDFRIGPYRGWQQHFDVPHVHTFADLVDEAEHWVRGNIGVQDRLQHFPQGTQMIGMYIEQDDSIILMEGHHRAAAIALAVADGTPLLFTEPPVLALTRYTGDPTAMLQRVLDTPSDNPNIHI